MEIFQLTVAECGVHERLQELRVAGRDEFKITPQIIACTFSFKNLASLKVLSECPALCQTFDLTDDDIDLLTEAMPHLESLAVDEEPCEISSQITSKTLRIHFNLALFVTKVDADSESGGVALGLSDINTPASDLCSVATINVGNIPLLPQPNGSYIMALWLPGVFPRIEGSSTVMVIGQTLKT